MDEKNVWYDGKKLGSPEYNNKKSHPTYDIRIGWKCSPQLEIIDALCLSKNEILSGFAMCAQSVSEANSEQMQQQSAQRMVPS